MVGIRAEEETETSLGFFRYVLMNTGNASPRLKGMAVFHIADWDKFKKERLNLFKEVSQIQPQFAIDKINKATIKFNTYISLLNMYNERTYSEYKKRIIEILKNGKNFTDITEFANLFVLYNLSFDEEYLEKATNVYKKMNKQQEVIVNFMFNPKIKSEKVLANYPIKKKVRKVFKQRVIK